MACVSGAQRGLGKKWKFPEKIRRRIVFWGGTAGRLGRNCCSAPFKEAVGDNFEGPEQGEAGKEDAAEARSGGESADGTQAEVSAADGAGEEP